MQAENSELTVSIVTVCWNCADVIEETVQSVLNQSYEPIEYVVIDGGSTDGTLDVIRAYEPQLASWISEPDDGISDAFNKGIQRTTGNLVGLINAGDMYEPGAIEQVVHSAGQAPDKDIFYGDIYMTDEKGEAMYVRTARREINASCFRYAMPAIPHPSVFVRQSLYEDRLFDPAINYAMDFEWLRAMAERGHQFQYVDGPCIARMRAEGKSNDQYLNTLAEVHRICTAYGDHAFLSYLYNRVFRSLRFRLRRGAEATKVGRLFVDGYRRVIAMLGIRNWEY